MERVTKIKKIIFLKNYWTDFDDRNLCYSD